MKYRHTVSRETDLDVVEIKETENNNIEYVFFWADNRGDQPNYKDPGAAGLS